MNIAHRYTAIENQSHGLSVPQLQLVLFMQYPKFNAKDRVFY